jgi:cytochrome c2
MKNSARLAVIAAVSGVVFAASPAAAQDATRGAEAFNPCRACHAIGPGARNKTGPQLNGIVGRKAAAVSGYPYSEAMKERAAAGLVWTEANLAAYLESPDAFLPNGVMAFRGIKDPAKLQDVIAFLKTHN